MKLKITAVLLVALLASSCGIGSYLPLIEAIVVAAATAAEASGVLPPVYAAYVDASIACADAAIKEAESMDTAEIKAAKITEACAAAVGSNAPTGIPPKYIALVSVIAQAVDNLLRQLGTVPKTSTVVRGQAFADKTKPATLGKPTVKERAKLKELAAKLAAAKVALHKSRL
jgi:hypothetical protein